MSFEKRTPERIYELGEGAEKLILPKRLGRSINQAPFHVVKEHYDEFSAGAKGLKECPQLPQLDENNLSDEFFAAQVDVVFSYIKRTKNISMKQLFYAGMTTERFFSALPMIEREAAKEMPTEYLQIFTAMAKGTLDSLFGLEETLDIEIGDQLKEELKAICNNYLNGQFAEDSGDRLKIRLKMQLCGLRRGTNRTEQTSKLTPHASSMYN